MYKSYINVPRKRSSTYLNDIRIPEVAAQEQVAGDRLFKCGISKLEFWISHAHN